MQKDDVMVKFYTKPKTTLQNLLYPVSKRQRTLQRII